MTELLTRKRLLQIIKRKNDFCLKRGKLVP